MDTSRRHENQERTKIGRKENTRKEKIKLQMK